MREGERTRRGAGGERGRGQVRPAHTGAARAHTPPVRDEGRVSHACWRGSPGQVGGRGRVARGREARCLLACFFFPAGRPKVGAAGLLFPIIFSLSSPRDRVAARPRRPLRPAQSLARTVEGRDVSGARMAVCISGAVLVFRQGESERKSARSSRLAPPSLSLRFPPSNAPPAPPRVPGRPGRRCLVRRRRRRCRPFLPRHPARPAGRPGRSAWPVRAVLRRSGRRGVGARRARLRQGRRPRQAEELGGVGVRGCRRPAWVYQW